MADDATIAAEIHAHAQQLLAFSREHKVAFFICIVDQNGAVHEASNASDRAREVIAESLVDTDTKSFSTHKQGGSA